MGDSETCPPRRDATTRTIRRQLFTSVTTSGMAVVRAWTRTAQVPRESRINTARGTESRRTDTAEASRMPREIPHNAPICDRATPGPLTVLADSDQNRARK